MILISKTNIKKSKNGYPVSYGLFLCPICSKEVERQLSNGKKQESCGCNKNVTHGDCNSRLYRIWCNMKKRCLNLNNEQYKDYGGRDIAVCAEWLEFIPFRDWAIQNGYEEELQIDRINNNGNYEPSNCKWSTSAENSQNRRNNVLTLEKANEIRELHKTGDYLQKELAKKYNVSTSTISLIINNKIWGNIND